ncbi:thermonuclease family protein, partial [Mesorhizobium sp. M7A.F.Ca.MR.228.00.0.0]
MSRSWSPRPRRGYVARPRSLWGR